MAQAYDRCSSLRIASRRFGVGVARGLRCPKPFRFRGPRAGFFWPPARRGPLQRVGGEWLAGFALCCRWAGRRSTSSGKQMALPWRRHGVATEPTLRFAMARMREQQTARLQVVMRDTVEMLHGERRRRRSSGRWLVTGLRFFVAPRRTSGTATAVAPATLRRGSGAASAIAWPPAPSSRRLPLLTRRSASGATPRAALLVATRAALPRVLLPARKLLSVRPSRRASARSSSWRPRSRSSPSPREQPLRRSLPELSSPSPPRRRAARRLRSRRPLPRPRGSFAHCPG